MRRAIANHSLFVLVMEITLAAAGTSAQSSPPVRPVPLDEARALISRAIANQHRNDAALAEYERRERVVEYRTEEHARAKEDKTYRVVPTGTGTLRLVVAEAGQPVDAELYRRQLRDLEQALASALDPNDREQRKRVEKWEKRREERREMVDAVGKAFKIARAERVVRDSRTLVRLELEPDPNYQPTSRLASVFSHTRVVAWIDEPSAQLVRAEAEIVKDISVFGGILGKIYKGGRYIFEQAEVAPGVWLPTSFEADIRGRKFLFGFSIHETTEIRNHRRIGPPAEALTAVRREIATNPATPAGN